MYLFEEGDVDVKGSVDAQAGGQTAVDIIIEHGATHRRGVCDVGVNNGMPLGRPHRRLLGGNRRRRWLCKPNLSRRKPNNKNKDNQGQKVAQHMRRKEEEERGRRDFSLTTNKQTNKQRHIRIFNKEEEKGLFTLPNFFPQILKEKTIRSKTVHSSKKKN
jgi:hypothetical protein